WAGLAPLRAQGGIWSDSHGGDERGASMRSRLARLGLVFGTLAGASALISGPAGAQTPAVFGGSATGTALNLSIAGNNLTGGVSVANAKSTLLTDAEGTGILTPGLTQDLKTSVNANNQTQNKPFAC